MLWFLLSILQYKNSLTMNTQNFRKTLPAIGLVLVSSNLIIGHYATSSGIIDFIRGLAVGIGFVFIVFPFIKKKPKALRIN
jgi:predicted MFS family arabinose efflux permease